MSEPYPDDERKRQFRDKGLADGFVNDAARREAYWVMCDFRQVFVMAWKEWVATGPTLAQAVEEADGTRSTIMQFARMEAEVPRDGV